jgi:hypothetical protein
MTEEEKLVSRAMSILAAKSWANMGKADRKARASHAGKASADKRKSIGLSAILTRKPQ